MTEIQIRALYWIALLIVSSLGVSLRGVGQWLTDEDPLTSADVIVAFGGGMPFRPEEAGKVFGMGYAAEVWVTRPEVAKAATGNQFPPEEEYTRTLIDGGVPPRVIHVLPESVVNTEEEVEEVAREMRLSGKTKVIIVTSPHHTRRVRALWKILAGHDLKAAIHAAHGDPFDATHWWRHSHDTVSVLYEVLGLVNAWTGLPVRPRSYLLMASREFR